MTRPLIALCLLLAACETETLYDGPDSGADIGYGVDCTARPDHRRCDAPPAIRITSPAANATVSGTITVSGTASDDRAVAGVDLQVDGGARSAATGTTSWTLSLETTGLSDGAHTLTARATDGAGQVTAASVSITVQNGTTPPAPTGVGPRSDIACPSGAVAISVGSNVQLAIDSSPAGSTFCFAAGTHTSIPSGGIVPRSGDRFVGQLGAVLDGNQTATYVFNFESGPDNVVIENLFIREGRVKGIHGAENASGAEIAFNDIGNNGNDGMSDGAGWWVHHNYIHHNGTLDQSESYGLSGFQPTASGVTITEDNEVAFNVWGSKWVGGANNAIVRRNFVHDNAEGGFWCDFCGPGFRFEQNRIERNGGQGIAVEGPCGSTAATPCFRKVINNTIEGHPTHGIFVTTASGTEVSGNTLRGNGQAGVQLFIHALNLGTTHADLRDNFVHDNVITVPSTSAWAVDMRCWNCTDTQAQPWVSNAKNNRFENNRYDVPDISAADWFWQGFKTFAQWRALGHDDTGTVQ